MDSLKAWQAERIRDSLFPSINYLGRLQKRMEETGFSQTIRCSNSWQRLRRDPRAVQRDEPPVVQVGSGREPEEEPVWDLFRGTQVCREVLIWGVVHDESSGWVALIFVACWLSPSGAAQKAEAPKPVDDAGIAWVDIRKLGVEGQGWPDTKMPFDRLPGRAEGLVREPVWNLSRHSAGLAVRFVTAADSIHARWTLTSPNLAMTHMPATGVSGLDLYVRGDDGKWRWLAVGQPKAQTNTVKLVGPLPKGETRVFALPAALQRRERRRDRHVQRVRMLSRLPLIRPGTKSPSSFTAPRSRRAAVRRGRAWCTLQYWAAGSIAPSSTLASQAMAGWSRRWPS